MSAVRQLALPLNGLDEASLYHPHDIGNRGFFALLWRDPRRTAAALDRLDERTRLQRQRVLAEHAGDEAAQLEAREALARRKPFSPVRQRSYRIESLPRILQALDPALDTWISQAEFRAPNRRTVNLLRVSLCFVDLDTYKIPALAERSPEALAAALRYHCAEEGLPPPSLIIYSGRGLQAKWLLTRPLPSRAVIRWSEVQRALGQRLKPLGADAQARDASRVLRLVNTVNTRSGEMASVISVTEGEDGEPLRYGFEYLAECCLPRSRAEQRAFLEADWEAGRRSRPARQGKERRRPIEGGESEGLQRLSGKRLAWDRLEDLRLLCRLRGWDTTGVPQGTQTLMLFWQINFLLLSEAVHPQHMWQEARELAARLPGWSKDLNSTLGTLYRKALEFEAGQEFEFQGRRYPALYTPKNPTLIELFAITPEEERQLTTVVSREEAARRHAERERERRRSAGAASRQSYLESAEQRRATARLLRTQGKSLRDIAAEMQVSKSAVSIWLREIDGS